LALRVVALTA